MDHQAVQVHLACYDEAARDRISFAVLGFYGINREFGVVLAIAFALCLLVVALSTQAHAESDQYKIRPLDLNNPADHGRDGRV